MCKPPGRSAELRYLRVCPKYVQYVQYCLYCVCTPSVPHEPILNSASRKTRPSLRYGTEYSTVHTALHCTSERASKQASKHQAGHLHRATRCGAVLCGTGQDRTTVGTASRRHGWRNILRKYTRGESPTRTAAEEEEEEKTWMAHLTAHTTHTPRRRNPGRAAGVGRERSGRTVIR